MNNMFRPVTRIWRLLPLSFKGVLTGIVCGLAVWVILEKFQSSQMEQILLADLERELEYVTRESRAYFSQGIERHSPAAHLLATQKKLQDYVASSHWDRNQAEEILQYNNSPPWLPPVSQWRILVRPTHFLLLDIQGHLKEVYSIRGDKLPRPLLNLTPLQLMLSQGQTYLANLEGQVVALANAAIKDQQGDPMGYLAVVSKLDSAYLETALQGLDLRFALVALIDPEDNLVVASSDPIRLQPGQALINIQQDYLVAGLDYHQFGEGSSELQYQFVTMLPRSLAGELNSQVVGLDRRNRLFAAFAFIVTFGVAIAIISRRIQKLAGYVKDVADRFPGVESSDSYGGDQIYRLDQRLSILSTLERQALYDALTGLPNRILLVDRIEQAILEAERNSQAFSVLVMDLNGFKEINDTLGHQAGDQVLQKFAKRLAECLRSTDTFARLGGDEFVVVLPGATVEEAERLAEKLQVNLKQPFEVDGSQQQIGASIGIAQYPDHGEDANALIKNADSAMYIAKQRHVDFIVYCNHQNL